MPQAPATQPAVAFGGTSQRLSQPPQFCGSVALLKQEPLQQIDTVPPSFGQSASFMQVAAHW